MWKTTGDPTTLTNWAAQDKGISVTGVVQSIWAVLDGTDIHVVISRASGSTSSTIAREYTQYVRFDTTTDEWAGGGTIEGPHLPALHLPAVTTMACSIAVRSDGDVIVVYHQDDTIRYDRREGGVWTGNFVVSNLTPAIGTVAVLGASDRVHIFWFYDGGDDILHRSLSSGNALDTEATVDAAVGASVLQPIGRGISVPAADLVYNVQVPYLDADESITIARFDSGANPTIATDTAASDNDAEDINSSLVAGLAQDGKRVWLLYSGGGASGVDQDIYSDTRKSVAAWGTDVEEQNAVTCNRLSAGHYFRAGASRLGYVWLDGTTTSYDEKTTDPVIGGLDLSDMEFPTDNFYLGPFGT